MPVPPTKMPIHYVEIGYLNDIIIRWKIDIAAHPGYKAQKEYEGKPSVLMLTQWHHVHRLELVKCRVPGEPGRSKHQITIEFFDALINDMLAVVQGEEPEVPITMERLHEATRTKRDLDDCGDFGEIWY